MTTLYKYACYAPFNNLFFGNRGAVMACCANKIFVLGEFPKQNLLEIWNGEKANELRQAIAERNFDKGCTGCRIFLENGNISGAPLTAYENQLQSNVEWPTRLEFELTNTCNLECIMCTGEYSSSIRERRERKPPIYDPYDESFIEQLNPFISHLHSARFVGGEPFLIARYFDIWEMMSEINPSIQIYIQTNGTILNSRVKKLLDKLNASISVSIDSLHPDVYSQIRVNGTLHQTLKNIEYFSSYCKAKGTSLSLSFCPMVNNWREIPDIVEFANNLNATVFFNTVYYPIYLSLKKLPATELQKIHNHLQQVLFPYDTQVQKGNYRKYIDLCSELRSFLQTANLVQHHETDNITFSLCLQRIEHHIQTRADLTAAQKKEKRIVIERNLQSFMEVAKRENLEIETLKGLNALPEDVIFQNVPVMLNVEVAFREFRERILATLKD